MTEMEKMEAMKRAYAEMILNTAKEAAARVMAAELRARRTEQELVYVKEEAASMLLRLKQMIDTKTKEAEISSLDQKNKFEELECQLNEAEGIILDLREELNQGQEQLDKLKKKQVVLKSRNEVNEEDCSLTPEVKSSGYEILTSSLNHGLEPNTISRNNLLSDWSGLDQESCSSAKQNGTLYSECDVYSGDHNAGLDQIKESDQFRNGCSLRTTATDTSLVEDTFSDVEKLNQREHCTNVESVDAVERTSLLEENIQHGNNEAAENADAVERTSLLEENIQHGNNEAASIVRRSVRKRKHKFWDDVIAACGLKTSHQFKKPRHGSADLSCLATHKMKRCVKNGEELAEGRIKIENLNDAEVSKELIHTEAVPENMELIDVLVKQDELAATLELTTASRIECGVEDGAAAKASNVSRADGSKLCKYKFNRKWRKKSAIFPEKVLDRSS